jgi:pimeloyl-ACP methyl ester carboxylesterase
MSKRASAIALGALFLLILPSSGAWALGVPSTDYDVVVEGIELRPGVEVDIHVEVFVNEAVPCHGRTLFAVHGFGHTAATWQPLVEALFADNPTGAVVCRVAAIDLPGRGGSTLPTNLTYGDLLLDDYVTAILGTLDGLRDQGVRPRIAVGHSQGGMLLQLAQQRLIDQGTDLLHRFLIHRAILLAPVPSAQIPWLFADSGVAGGILSLFLTVDPVLGAIIFVPDAAFPDLYFTDLAGVLASGAPTPAQVAALGYNAPEPLLSALNLVGAPPFSRPMVDAGIFGPGRGTRLFVAAYQEDRLIRPEESALLYELLTGDAHGRRFAAVAGPETVHDLHLSDPAGLLAAVAGVIRF